jgi:long-chain acyl-CoA synthetase
MSWAELKAEVEIVAAGLSAAGFGRGMKLALIGENRPRLYVGMIAAQVLGGVPVPLYQDAVAQEMVYVFRDAGITFAIVEDQVQVD